MHTNAYAPWQVKTDQTNEWVFNTEAHPIRLANNGRGQKEIGEVRVNAINEIWYTGFFDF